MRSELRFSYHRTNGVTLHVAQAGPPHGKPLILLHGVPEFWYGWRHQIDVMAEAGFLVVAPDQRGYNQSDRPAGVGFYDPDLLAKDIVGLADALGHRRFHLVGHDWGATVGWWLAAHYPEHVKQFAALSAPHPSVWIEAMRTIPEQRRKSRYVRALRIPWLPELFMRRRNFRALVDALCDTMRPGVVSEADLARYREAWSRPGALTGMVNWYRALMRRADTTIEVVRVSVPTLVIWGDRDRFSVPALGDRSTALCNAATLARLDASHWVQHDEPERVNALLLEFLAPRPPRPPRRSSSPQPACSIAAGPSRATKSIHQRLDRSQARPAGLRLSICCRLQQPRCFRGGVPCRVGGNPSGAHPCSDRSRIDGQARPADRSAS